MCVYRLLLCALLVNISIVYNGGCSTSTIPPNQKGNNNTTASEESEFVRLRGRMVEVQLRGRDIEDVNVLAAMTKVPRHEFVPPDLTAYAYDDRALPLKLGQTISQPYIVAYMTQLLRLKGTESVLEIGTGSGYQAAVLAELVKEVYTIEILPELGRQAAAVLSRLGYGNIHFRIGDGYAGWAEYAPFDGIIVTAAPGNIPPPLIEQLKVGGRIVCPVGELDQDLIVLEKGEKGITRRTTIPVRFVPMTGKAREK
jgi:protein-L-isoaspartate(D-aspartate) O-methyltransferase